MTDTELSVRQRAMIALWERHTAAEFASKSLETTMATMTHDPVVNHVPLMTGGEDVALVPLARTVGTDRIVDELIFSFTHTIDMPGFSQASRQRAAGS
ncbi:MAG: hypothetical protein H0W67_04945, partial [Gemmatimonadales bacterium]|nr:hypothetical protein [Gemmatimonadales bacterium]